jgi:hypothetical protein
MLLNVTKTNLKYEILENLCLDEKMSEDKAIIILRELKQSFPGN